MIERNCSYANETRVHDGSKSNNIQLSFRKVTGAIVRAERATTPLSSIAQPLQV